MDNQIINKKIQELKQQQIKIAKEDNKRLADEIKQVIISLSPIITCLYLKYKDSSKNIQRVKVLKELEIELIKHRKKLNKSTKDIIYSSLISIFLDTYNGHNKLIKMYSDSINDNHIITNDEIHKIIQRKFYDKTLDKRINDNNDLIFNKTYKKVIDSLKNDTPLDDILKDVDKIFDITAIGMGERLLNTESTRVFAEAQIKALEDSKITQVMWCADLCQNTCDYCASNDREIFPIDDKTEIPAHANCNCYWEIV